MSVSTFCEHCLVDFGQPSHTWSTSGLGCSYDGVFSKSGVNYKRGDFHSMALCFIHIIAQSRSDNGNSVQASEHNTL